MREDIQCPQGNMRCCVEKPRKKKPNKNPIDNNVSDSTTAKTTTVKVNKIKKKKRKTTTEPPRKQVQSKLSIFELKQGA